MSKVRPQTSKTVAYRSIETTVYRVRKEKQCLENFSKHCFDEKNSYRENYQLAFVMPGRYPARALSRKQSLEERNFFKTPLPRPVNWQRLRRRTGHVSLGILFRLIRAASRSSSVREGSIARFLNSWRFSQCLATRISRFFCRFTTDFFAILRTILYFFLAGPF